MNKREKGKKNEDLAVEFLKSKGYNILQRNFYTRSGEIDIVALKDDTVVFVEVRSFSKSYFGLPQESINKTKIKKIVKAAQQFLYKYNLTGKNVRFDVVAIFQDSITHIENAFTLDYL